MSLILPNFASVGQGCEF